MSTTKKTAEQTDAKTNGLNDTTPAQPVSTDVIESAPAEIRVGSVVAEPNTDQQPAPKGKKKKKGGLFANMFPSKQAAPDSRNYEDQTIQAIPTGNEKKAPTPIFEREAIQIKFDENLSSRTDTASTYATLKTYMSQGRTLEGRIAGVTIYNNVPCWSIFHNNTSIYIPLNESYMTISKSLMGNTPAIIADQKNFMAQSIGLTVEFVLTSLMRDPDHPDSFIATASRTTALARKRAAYFGQRLLRVGSDITCRVISVSAAHLFVTVAGLDVFVHRKHLTRRYVKHMSDMYQVDDKITMRVHEIEYGDSSTLPSIMISAIPLEEERCQANRYRLNPGERCHAIVTYLDDGARHQRNTGRINMWLEDYEYYATTTLNLENLERPISIGSHVLYEHRTFTDRGFSSGLILRILDR